MRWVLASLLVVGIVLVGCGLHIPCESGAVCETPGPRCSYMEGSDACSMIPRRYVCECDGKIHAVPDNFRQPACGSVRTWCDGRVLGYREVTSFALPSPP